MVRRPRQGASRSPWSVRDALELALLLLLGLAAGEDRRQFVLILGTRFSGKFHVGTLMDRHPEVFFAGELRNARNPRLQGAPLTTLKQPAAIVQWLINNATSPVVVGQMHTTVMAGLTEDERKSLLDKCALTVLVRRCDKLLEFAMIDTLRKANTNGAGHPNGKRPKRSSSAVPGKLTPAHGRAQGQRGAPRGRALGEERQGRSLQPDQQQSRRRRPAFNRTAFEEFRRAERNTATIPRVGTKTISLTLETDASSSFRLQLTLQRIFGSLGVPADPAALLVGWEPHPPPLLSALVPDQSKLPPWYLRPQPTRPTCPQVALGASDVLVLIPYVKTQRVLSHGRELRYFGGFVQRMIQVLNVLSAMGLRLHVISTGPIVLPREHWLPSTALLYAPVTLNDSQPMFRPLKDQLEDVHQASTNSSTGFKIGTFVGFSVDLTTSLRVRAANVNNTDPDPDPWFLEPPKDSYTLERVLTFVRGRLDGREGRTVRTVAVVDDVHHVRAADVLAAVPGVRPEHLVEVQRWLKVREASIYSSCDAVLAVSEEDATRFTALFQGRSNPHGQSTQSLWLPMATDVKCRFDLAPSSKRRGALYAGNAHPAAVEGLRWFLHSILPRVVAHMQQQGYGAQADNMFKLVGMWKGDGEGAQMVEQSTQDTRHVDNLGQLPDYQLGKLYEASRVFVVPHFSATGVSTKMIKAMARGLPVVTTGSGLSGIGNSTFLRQAVRVADDAEGFARHVVTLLTQEDVWAAASDAALNHASEALASESMCRALLHAVRPDLSQEGSPRR